MAVAHEEFLDGHELLEIRRLEIEEEHQRAILADVVRQKTVMRRRAASRRVAHQVSCGERR